jgi:hypothetical protein
MTKTSALENAQAKTPEVNHLRIDEKIVDELFDIVPEDWTSFVLTITSDGSKIALDLSNTEEDEDIEPSETLHAACLELAAFLKQQEQEWETIRYEAALQDDGDWSMTITVPLLEDESVA